MRAAARVFAAALLLAACTVSAHAGDTAVVAHDLKLVKSTGRVWAWSNGSWLARMVARGEMVEGEFVLPQPLPAGQYRFFVRANNGGATIRLACGGGVSAPSVPNDQDGSGLWSDPILLDVKNDAATLTLAFTNTTQIDAVNFIFQALFITDRPGVSVDGSDCLVLPAAGSGPPHPPELGVNEGGRIRDVKGNLLPNGSFEAGLGHGWLISVPKERRDQAQDAYRQAAGGFDAKGCIALPDGARLISRVIPVRPGRKHTFSVWAKAEAGDAEVALELYNAHRGNTGGPLTSLTQRFPVKGEWQRLSLGGALSGTPSAEYQVSVAAAGGTVRVDALQLEEGDASEYRPAAALEIGLACDRPGSVFFEDEPVAMQLLVANAGERPAAARVRYEVYDYLNRKVKEGSLAVNAPAGGGGTGSLDLATGKRGSFRVVAWTEGRQGAEEEAIYAVVPRPQRAGPDPTSMIGMHAQASDFQYDVLSRLGVKWTRVMSPELWFRWQAVEPERGQITWYDAEAEKTVRHGFRILGTIGTNGWPKWAEKDGLPDLDAWEEFVGRIVAHYKPWVKTWEIWNEPVYAFKPDFYAKLLESASRAIRQADPEAKVVGMGGSYACDWCLGVIQQLGGKPAPAMDYFSTHIYPEKADPMNPLSDAGAKVFREKIIQPFGIEVWNTEAGAWCQGMLQGPDSGFRTAGEPIWPFREAWRYYRGFDYEAARVARSFLHSIGNGFSRYFYYDSRFHLPYYSMGRSHCTIFDAGDAVRAKGIAYAILARFFDHSRGLGDVSPKRDTCAYLFDRGGTPLAALFATDDGNVTTTKAIALALAPGRVRAYDMMGNELSLEGAVVAYGRQPVYLEGAPGLTVGELRAAIEKGRISDVPDKTPPALSISDGPRGTVPAGPARFRWIAIDAVSIPCNDIARDAILYSYRLAGRDAAWSPWSEKTRVEYNALPPGTYRFEVKAKDASGNETEVAGREFAVK